MQQNRGRYIERRDEGGFSTITLRVCENHKLEAVREGLALVMDPTVTKLDCGEDMALVATLDPNGALDRAIE